MKWFNPFCNNGLHRDAKVAELADAPDLGSGPARGGGSSPPFRTRFSFQGFVACGGLQCFHGDGESFLRSRGRNWLPQPTGAIVAVKRRAQKRERGIRQATDSPSHVSFFLRRGSVRGALPGYAPQERCSHSTNTCVPGGVIPPPVSIATSYSCPRKIATPL